MPTLMTSGPSHAHAGTPRLGDENSLTISVAPALEGLLGVSDVQRSSQEALYATAITPDDVASSYQSGRAPHGWTATS